jgi:putative transposase
VNDIKLFKYRPNAYHHVTFSTKRRKKVLVGEVKDRIHFWFEELARENGIRLEEYNSWLDHVHLLIFVGIGEDLSYFLNILKGTCARRIFEEFDGLKAQIRENHLWGRRFHADEIPASEVGRVREYIRRQEDIHLRRMGMKPLAELERWRDLVD